MTTVLNISDLPSPPELAQDTGVERKERRVTIPVGDKTLEVHTVEVVNPEADSSNRLTVVFLHGGKFSSQNWVDIQTLDHLASWGHRALAIDLPGRGKTTDTLSPELNPDFLPAFLAKVDAKRVVIVSPSSSGKYAFPYLFKDGQTSTKRAVGFVAVAPSTTADFKNNYPDSQLPTLILYGTEDPAGPATLSDLSLLPKSYAASMEGCGHPCYLEKPDEFHKILYYFLKQLE